MLSNFENELNDLYVLQGAINTLEFLTVAILILSCLF